MGIMEKKMETSIMGYMGYRIWGVWGSCYNIPRAIFYLLKGTIGQQTILQGTCVLARRSSFTKSSAPKKVSSTCSFNPDIVFEVAVPLYMRKNDRFLPADPFQDRDFWELSKRRVHVCVYI